MEYYGSKKKGGVNGHFYHVFNTVRRLLVLVLSLILWLASVL